MSTRRVIILKNLPIKSRKILGKIYRIHTKNFFAKSQAQIPFLFSSSSSNNRRFSIKILLTMGLLSSGNSLNIKNWSQQRNRICKLQNFCRFPLIFFESPGKISLKCRWNLDKKSLEFFHLRRIYFNILWHFNRIGPEVFKISLKLISNF